jgi:hypothetical protein
MAYQPGPKELQARALRERRFEQRTTAKPTTDELRAKVATVKAAGKPKKAAKAKPKGKKR